MAWVARFLTSCILRVRDFHVDSIACLAEVVICSRGLNCAVVRTGGLWFRRAMDGSGLRDLPKAVENKVRE